MNDLYALKEIAFLAVRSDPTGYIEDFEISSSPFRFSYRLFDKTKFELLDYQDAVDIGISAIKSNIENALAINVGMPTR